VNPWQALMRPEPAPNSRPPAIKVLVPAAALVVNHRTGFAQLVPIIACDFAQERNYWL
jgi:hypothetical protein